MPRAARGQSYRGVDRRGLIATAGPVEPGVVRAAVVVLLVVTGSVVVLTGPNVTDAVATRLAPQVQGAAVTAGLLAGVLCLARWRLVGEAAALYLGLASGVLVVGVLGPPVVLGGAGGPLGTGPVEVGGHLVAAGLVVLAVIAPPVDARVRPARVGGVALAAMGVSAVLISQLPGLERLVLGHSPAAADPGGLFALPVVPAVWCLLGVWTVAASRRRRQPLLAWFGLGLLILSVAQLFGPTGDLAAGSAVLLTGWLQLGCMLCLGVGAGQQLVRAFRAQDGRLLDSVSSARAVQERLDADLRAREERAHEAHNVLLAIEAATVALERYREQLAPGDQEALSSSVIRGVERLQRLVETAPPLEPATRFHPSEVVAPLITALRSQGTEVLVDVPAHLVATGQPLATAQVVHNLLENARRYGRGPVRLTAILDHDQVVLRVTDAGAGIPAEERDTIFERGARGTTAAGVAGSGLGLHIARELMCRQVGGELHLVPSSGSGATFELRLPGRSTLLAEQTVEEFEDLVQPAATRERLRLVRRSASHLDTATDVEEDHRASGIAAR